MIRIDIEDVEYLRSELDAMNDVISRLENDLDRVMATLEAMQDDGK